jgi:hypothetical protein
LFVEAVGGSPAAAVLFWVSLFSAAVANKVDDAVANETGRRWM